MEIENKGQKSTQQYSIPLLGSVPDFFEFSKALGISRREVRKNQRLKAKNPDNNLIFIGSPIPFDADEFLAALDSLMNAAYANNDNICSLVADIVTTYHPSQG